MKSVNQHLTNQSIAKLREQARKTGKQLVARHSHPEADVRLRISPGGTCTWYVRRVVAGREFQPDLGKWPDVTIGQAEAKAEDMHRALKDGTQPAGTPTALNRATGTLSEALELMLVKRKYTILPTTANEYRADIARLGWQARKLESVTESECRTRMDRFIAADHLPTGLSALKTLSRLYEFMKRQGLYGGPNPCRQAFSEGWPSHSPEQRRFKHQEDWARAFVRAAAYPSRVIGAHWQVCALMPNRPWHELAGLRWTEVDFDEKTIFIPAERLKVKKGAQRKRMNRDPRGITLPMTTHVEAILRELHSLSAISSLSDQQRAFVFPARRRDSKVGHLDRSANQDLLKVMRKEAKDAEFETYSLKRFWTTVAKKQAKIDLEIRYCLADQQLNVGIQDQVYTDPLTADDMREGAQLVADRLMAVVASFATRGESPQATSSIENGAVENGFVEAA